MCSILISTQVETAKQGKRERQRRITWRITWASHLAPALALAVARHAHKAIKNRGGLAIAEHDCAFGAIIISDLTEERARGIREQEGSERGTNRIAIG